MKICFAVFAALILATASSVAQQVCRQAKATVVERQVGFTMLDVSLPSGSGILVAKALLPNTHSPASGIVFSLAAVVQSEPKQTVENDASGG